MGRWDDARAAMACHYEAGRAVAHWWGGIGPLPINIPRDAAGPNISRGNTAVSVRDVLDDFLALEASGPFPFGGTPLDSAWRKWDRLEMALVTCYAGSVAWARHRKRTVESCLIGDGRSDVERANAILDRHLTRVNLLGRSPHFCRQKALASAVMLVRSRQGWAAVSSIADRLWRRGFASAGEVSGLCSAAFGPGWDPQWPPCRGALDGGTAQEH